MLPPAPVHGDLRLDNVLSSDGGVVLLDWEMFGLGDPALEVARFLHDSHRCCRRGLLDDWLDAYPGSLGTMTTHSLRASRSIAEAAAAACAYRSC